jgi:NitT/TauT family transport system ATP-binding protein
MSIELAAVSKRFGTRNGTHHALSGVTLDIRAGELVCLVGPSGCGKSTLLNLIAGLERPDEGQVTVFGKKVSGPGPDRMVMFQDSALFPTEVLVFERIEARVRERWGTHRA